MEAFIVLLVAGFFLAPLILSIAAVSSLGKIRKDIRSLQDQMSNRSGKETNGSPVPEQSADRVFEEESVADETFETVANDTIDAPEDTVASVLSESQPSTLVDIELQNNPKPLKPKLGMEFMMGGRAAAYLGISILVIGIVFLVSYAIQNSWIGPGLRVIGGLFSGVALVVLGHLAERKHQKYQLIARVLTGGGCSLFYFTVFAAYSFYGLITPLMVTVGLILSATSVFALATLYRSQAVGVLGVVGAFMTPLLTEGQSDVSLFILSYVALINVPVILLGCHRKWQPLYNLAFAFTVFYFAIWHKDSGSTEILIGLSFGFVYFAEFAALALYKLKGEQHVTGRTLDIVRLVLSSLLLLFSVQFMFRENNLTQWLGTAFIFLAFVHISLAYLAQKTVGRFGNEILSFLAGALLFAAMALPAQFDGAWVSLGWAIEGLILAFLSTRVKSHFLHLIAFILGMIGIMKGLVFDWQFYSDTPDAFMNSRFLVGIIATILLGLQGVVIGRFNQEEEGAISKWKDPLWHIAILGGIIVFFSDVFWTMGFDAELAWLLTTLSLLAVAVWLLLLGPKHSTITILGGIFLLTVPVKILLLDTFYFVDDFRSITSIYPWINLSVLVFVICILPMIGRRGIPSVIPSLNYVKKVNLLSISSGLGIITVEIYKLDSVLAEPAVTIFWAVCALILISIGMKFRNTGHRYLGLILFGLSIGKVLLVDSSELAGLGRIAAFIGTGLLLLVISFVYQKATAFFESIHKENPTEE